MKTNTLYGTKVNKIKENTANLKTTVIIPTASLIDPCLKKNHKHLTTCNILPTEIH